MTCEYVFRDVTDIYSRLFNHRAALQGLSNNFVREFEEKRGSHEHASLSRTLDLVIDCRDRSVPTTHKFLENNLEPLKVSVEKTKDLCDRIMKDADEKKTDWLESQRERRAHEWKEFMEAQVVRSSRVDTEFDNKVGALQRHYTELEEKLRNSTSRLL